MKKLLLYPHGGSGNHGCEAIVRSTLKAMSETGPSACETILSSSRPDEDAKFGLDRLCRIILQNRPIARFSAGYVGAAIRKHFFRDGDAYDKLSYHEFFDLAGRDSVALSIGGDNYCYGKPRHLYFLNRCLRAKGTRTVLWGASIEPEAMDSEMVKDLSGYDLIFARESVTYEALRGKGLSVISRYCPDPAFLLERADRELPEGFAEGKTVGINLSPLSFSYEKNSGATMEACLGLIRHIIDRTDFQIALIPHVRWSGNDDITPLKALHERFKRTGRVVLIAEEDGFSCMELKGFISRCRIMIAARTHASIAAYSQGVPALVLGYSVKASGIARDLFGTEKDFVVPVQSISASNDLIRSFDMLVCQEHELKARLLRAMPQYRSKIQGAAKEVQSLF